MTTNLKFIDLCCGIDGFHQALHKLNFKLIFLSKSIYYKRYN